MIRILLIFVLCIITKFATPQCTAPTGLSTSNINYYNASANWTTVLAADFYKIRYRQSGATSWQYINNIDSSLNTKTITNLSPLNHYTWQIKSYCDSVTTSPWSSIDTFTTITNNCPNSNTLFTTNITHNNVLANWGPVSGANRYKIRYKNLASNSWVNSGATYHPSSSMTIPLLQSNTAYEWQIRTYHDSTTLLSSLWSASDTFTTISFVAAPFNPIITNSLSSLECNVQAELYLKITQAQNEPDIGTGTITSDGGHFAINSISPGDSVGHALMTTATQNISATLNVGMIFGQNDAIINSYDSSGSLIGIFTIKNQNGGIKVELLGSPNDGNNHTNGYVSEIYFTNLFVNPQNAGPLHFYADINSELNDQIYAYDTVQIWCNTNQIINHHQPAEAIAIYDVLGKPINKRNKSAIQIFKFSDGTTKKYVFIGR